MSDETKRFIAVVAGIVVALSVLSICATWAGVDARHAAIRLAELAVEAKRAKP